MYHQPPLTAAIVRAKPPPLHGGSWKAMQGVPPCTPRRSKKLMWLRRKERERNQAPILGGGDLPARANTTAWGLMGDTDTLPCKGQVHNLPLCLSGERKSFAGCRGFFKKPPCWEPPAGGGAKPLPPRRACFIFAENGITRYTIYKMGIPCYNRIQERGCFNGSFRQIYRRCCGAFEQAL